MKLSLVEANQYGVLKSKGCPSGMVDLRVFAAFVREAQKEGWTAPAELLAMADEQAAPAGAPPAEQPTPAEAQRPQPRLRDKPKTLVRNEGWQARINDHARNSPGKSHAHYCRTLAKEENALAKEDKRISPRTIARVTKPPPS